MANLTRTIRKIVLRKKYLNGREEVEEFSIVDGDVYQKVTMAALIYEVRNTVRHGLNFGRAKFDDAEEFMPQKELAGLVHVDTSYFAKALIETAKNKDFKTADEIIAFMKKHGEKGKFEEDLAKALVNCYADRGYYPHYVEENDVKKASSEDLAVVINKAKDELSVSDSDIARAIKAVGTRNSANLEATKQLIEIYSPICPEAKLKEELLNDLKEKLQEWNIYITRYSCVNWTVRRTVRALVAVSEIFPEEFAGMKASLVEGERRIIKKRVKAILHRVSRGKPSFLDEENTRTHLKACMRLIDMDEGDIDKAYLYKKVVEGKK